jgi:outer membrane protein assembly factor BamB
MKRSSRRLLCRAILPAVALMALALSAAGDDWPQFRGPHSNNHVTGFTAPATWPKELKKQWSVTVGEGLASPALVGDKVYTFTRQGGDEVIFCLDAATGKEVWKDKYATDAVKGPASGYPGPRSSPAVGDGKVCTFGVVGVLSCLDAASGKVAWRKDTKGKPSFYTSQSPVIADGKCIIDVGGPEGKGGKGGGKGELTAFDLATGDAKWKVEGEAPSYGSPVVATIDGTKQVVVLTSANLIGVALADGKILWSTPFPVKMGEYQTATPVIDGNTVICGGTAFTIEKSGDKFEAKQAWKGTAPHLYNTPVLKDGVIYGLAGTMGPRAKTTNIYAQDAKTGKELWKDGTNRGECGSILDAGPVLVELSSDDNLVVFKPDKTEFKEVAKYKVADSPTWAMPVLAGKRIYVKDKDSLILWTVE